MDGIGQRAVRHVGHYQEEEIVLDPIVVDRQYMRMAELDQEAPLAEDPERLGIGGEGRVGDAHNLDSYLVRIRIIGVLIVLGQVDLAHTATPDQAEQPIVPEGLALQMCHLPPSSLPSSFFWLPVYWNFRIFQL